MPTPTHPVAIITGASSGIGRATALKLAALHYRLALIARREAPLQKLADQLPTDTVVIPTDVSDPAQVESMVQQVLHTFDRIDVLINNAGTAPSTPLATMPIPDFHHTLNTNLASAFYTTRAVWPIMTAQHDSADPHALHPGGGVIINISSMAAKDPFPGLGAYAIAKAGLNMLTLVTAREGAPVGIRVHCLAPAATDTPMYRNLVGEQNVHPEKILTPDHIADTIAAVLTGPLTHISGETIYLHHSPA